MTTCVIMKFWNEEQLLPLTLGQFADSGIDCLNLFDEVNKQAANDYPCKYNISRNEFRELIDSGAGNEPAVSKTHNAVELSHFLKVWYEQDIRYIDWLLKGLKPGTDRYKRLMGERQYRANVLDGAV